MNIGILIRLLRPRQWVKNGFVFAAPAFGGVLLQLEGMAASVAVFCGFCLLSGSAYLFNDWHDLEEDRGHPEKCKRPLASGEAPLNTALAWGGLVCVAGLAILFAAGGLLTLCAGLLFLILNVVYTLLLKHLVVLDVMGISGSFLLRILGGAAAVRVPVSYWLLLCAGSISLFLAFVKRRAELMELGDKAHQHRAVLAHYSVAFLDQMVSVVTAITLLCYTLYTVDERTVSVFGSRMFIVTVPIVIYGLFRYLYLTYHRKGGSNPSELVVTDPGIIAAVVLWAGVCLLLIYGGQTWFSPALDILT